MRYAVVSDIHSNLSALESVLEAIKKHNVDRIICCGDLVGYFTFANECIDLCRANDIFSIAGNHDLAVSEVVTDLSEFWEVAVKAILWTRTRLTVENQLFLTNLPRTSVVDNRLVLFHGAISGDPFPEMVRLVDAQSATKTFQDLCKHYPGIRVGFFGHIHRPCVISSDGSFLDIKGQHTVDLIGAGSTETYFVNPGSVGLSRDEDPRASFVIYDSSEQTVSFRRVEFDNTVTLREARAEGLYEPRYRRRIRRYARRVMNRVRRVAGRESK